METHGLKLTEVLLRAYQSPFTTRSNFARLNPELVAVCACEGLITTRNTESDTYGNVWYISVMGLMRLRELGTNNEFIKRAG